VKIALKERDIGNSLIRPKKYKNYFMNENFSSCLSIVSDYLFWTQSFIFEKSFTEVNFFQNEKEEFIEN
jgi:hypothetical protein